MSRAKHDPTHQGGTSGGGILECSAQQHTFHKPDELESHAPLKGPLKGFRRGRSRCDSARTASMQRGCPFRPTGRKIHGDRFTNQRSLSFQNRQRLESKPVPAQRLNCLLRRRRQHRAPIRHSMTSNQPARAARKGSCTCSAHRRGGRAPTHASQKAQAELANPVKTIKGQLWISADVSWPL